MIHTASICTHGHVMSGKRRGTHNGIRALVVLCSSDLAEIQAAHSQDGVMQTLSVFKLQGQVAAAKSMIIQGGCMQGCAHPAEASTHVRMEPAPLHPPCKSLLTRTCAPSSSDTQPINPTLTLGGRASLQVFLPPVVALLACSSQAKHGPSGNASGLAPGTSAEPTRTPHRSSSHSGRRGVSQAPPFLPPPSFPRPPTGRRPRRSLGRHHARPAWTTPASATTCTVSTR